MMPWLSFQVLGRIHCDISPCHKEALTLRQTRTIMSFPSLYCFYKIQSFFKFVGCGCLWEPFYLALPSQEAFNLLGVFNEPVMVSCQRRWEALRF